MNRRAPFALLTFLIFGCAHTGVPLNARFDEAASEVTIARSFDRADRGTARRFRAAIVDASPSPTGKPARFQARVFTERKLWPLAPFLLGGAFLGCPIAIDATRVELLVEFEGARYRGRGSSSSLPTLYNLFGMASGGNVRVNEVREAARDALMHLQIEAKPRVTP